MLRKNQIFWLKLSVGPLSALFLCLMGLIACGNPGDSLSLGEIKQNRDQSDKVSLQVTVKNLGADMDRATQDNGEAVYCVKAEWFIQSEPTKILSQVQECIAKELKDSQFVELALLSKDSLPKGKSLMVKVFFSKESSDPRFKPVLQKVIPSL